VPFLIERIFFEQLAQDILLKRQVDGTQIF
jgi:hypothetical protein